MTTDEPRVTISVVVPDEAHETLVAYRDRVADLDTETLGLVDELVEKGQARITGRAAGAGAGEPDRGDGDI
ncbi:hypothetical protein SAMN05428985_11518 [Nocardioides sp. YR527]|uniref:hypothetical protein n=1 Tax=Nocardioides sp. YR527 TaxID=1881028 RepID=UPI00088618D7|nr:hypothetical protein [Nocardioides sp. YR527]SDL33838.1 hypothetical protein SAMN05428985_11518 [Nocardioides sp. YR527]